MWTHWSYKDPEDHVTFSPFSQMDHQNLFLSPDIGVFFQLVTKLSFNKWLTSGTSHDPERSSSKHLTTTQKPGMRLISFFFILKISENVYGWNEASYSKNYLVSLYEQFQNAMTNFIHTVISYFHDLSYVPDRISSESCSQTCISVCKSVISLE